MTKPADLANRPSELIGAYPDAAGRFGEFGGRFVAETLMGPIEALTAAYERFNADPEFHAELRAELRNFVGRPSPLYHARRLSETVGGAQIWLKREDLNHTGAHKVNNTVGQALLATRMGKTRIIAETGAGQHGVAAATVAARLGLECVVYMGEEDVHRQAPNVYRMRLLGAEVRSVTSGTRTLKDALNEAMRDWVTNVDDTYYIIGTVAGPHPYPRMVRDFNSVIGREARAQILEQAGRLPDAVVACVGGGFEPRSACFTPFWTIRTWSCMASRRPGTAWRPGGTPPRSAPAGRRAARQPDVSHAGRGRTDPGHPLDIGRSRLPGSRAGDSWLKDIGRAIYTSATDAETLAAFERLTRIEGIIPALESSHALAHAEKLARDRPPEDHVIVNLSGRGDKDIPTVAALQGIEDLPG